MNLFDQLVTEAIQFTELKRETGNVDTWKFKIITRPEQRLIPNIDICSIPSYDKKLTVLQNHYGLIKEPIIFCYK
ncbi:MAG: hypothetical protein V3U84_03710 [Thiotrichaceae bacterium]